MLESFSGEFILFYCLGMMKTDFDCCAISFQIINSSCGILSHFNVGVCFNELLFSNGEILN